MSTLLGLDTDNSRVGEFVEVTPIDLLERSVVGDNNKYRCEQLPTYPDEWSCHLLAPDVSIGDSMIGWIFVALFCRLVTTVSDALTVIFRQTACLDVSRPCQTAR